MVKFKYVDFSKSTAKRNPDMIIREYKRIFDECNDVINALNGTTNKCSIDIYKIDLEKEYKRMVAGVHTRSSIQATFSITELKHILYTLESKSKQLDNLLKKRSGIELELIQFKKKYDKW